MSKIIQEREDIWKEVPGMFDEFGFPLEVHHFYPAILRCDCGEEFELQSDPEVCPKCGQYYNLFGQPLAHPSQWENEGDDYLDEDVPFGQDMDPFDWM